MYARIHSVNQQACRATCIQHISVAKSAARHSVTLSHSENYCTAVKFNKPGVVSTGQKSAQTVHDKSATVDLLVLQNSTESSCALFAC